MAHPPRSRSWLRKTYLLVYTQKMSCTSTHYTILILITETEGILPPWTIDTPHSLCHTLLQTPVTPAMGSIQQKIYRIRRQIRAASRISLRDIYSPGDILWCRHTTNHVCYNTLNVWHTVPWHHNSFISCTAKKTFIDVSRCVQAGVAASAHVTGRVQRWCYPRPTLLSQQTRASK